MGAMKHEDALYCDEAEQLREEVRRLRAELGAVRAQAAVRSQPQIARGPVVVGRGIEDEPVILAGKRYAEWFLAVAGADAQIEVLDLGRDQKMLLRIGDIVQEPA